MSKDQDTEYREHLVTEVSREKGGWSINSEDGWSFYVDDKYAGYYTRHTWGCAL